MSHHIFEINLDQWDAPVTLELSQAVTTALESGKVIFLPRLNFSLEPAQQSLLSLTLNPKGAKNISYDAKNQRLRGIDNDTVIASLIKPMMQRYHYSATKLLEALCPQYQTAHCAGRTSFRPVEIKGRKPVSYRKDDTRLHVDAFPSTPVDQLRILRVFTNINPHGENRFWRLGEPYSEVVRQFLPKVRRRFPFEADILYALKATRKKRTYYDHCMLQIHNAMKADIDYQNRCQAVSMNFPPGSTWIVYTDLVSHAALAGRFVLEQTYYPSLENMQNPGLSPQHQMRSFIQGAL